MEHRITITVAGLSASPDDADRLLEVLLEQRPELGPVVSSNTTEDRITITVAYESNDAVHAVGAAGVIARDAIAKIPFAGAGRIVDVDVERIDTPVAA